MSSIDKFSGLFSDISTLATAQARRTTVKSNTSTSRQDTRANVELLGSKALLLSRLRAIREDDEQRQRKAFRAYLGYILVERLGDHLVADPKFDSLVEQTLTHFESHEKLMSMMRRASDVLMKEARANQ